MEQVVVLNSKGGCGKSTFVLALADLMKADIIDLDPQGTITKAATFTGRFKPIKTEKEATGEYVIYDTPPYHAEETKGLLQVASFVIIPCKINVPDLLATNTVIEELRKIGKLAQATIVFNEVRKPLNKTYREIKQLFKGNYADVRIARTEISNLIAYQRILSDPLAGKAKAEITSLIKEIFN